MRRLLTLILILASAGPQVLARDKNDWERVKKLKHGTSVYVTLMKGQPVSGRVVGADEGNLRLATLYPWDNGVPEMIARDNVERIVIVRHRILPDPRGVITWGMLIGGAVGTTAGAIGDIRHGNNDRWLVDGLGGVGSGFFAACMAEAGFGIAALFRHDKVIYENHGAGRNLSAARQSRNG